MEYLHRRAVLKRLAGVVLAAFASTAGMEAAMAQQFPTRPVKIVVPFGAGGTTDLVARLISPALSEQLGQTVVIENRGGAGGLIGAEAVARSPADGHTLLLTNISFPLAALTAQRAKRASFDPFTELTGVTVVVDVPMIITAPPSVPASNLRELATLLQTDKSLSYNYGSTGPGSFLNVFGEFFQRDAKVALVHIPFKGAAQLKQELLAGRIQLGGDQLSSSLGEVKSGSLRALATTSPERSRLLPDVPTVKELGFPSMQVEGWNGILAPANTPPDVIAKLQKAVAIVVSHPDMQRRMLDLGAEPSGSSTTAFNEILKRQATNFRPVIETIALD